MKNITFEGISTLQRLHLCWQIRKQIGKIHQPIKVEFHQPICRKQYSSLWYGGLVVSIKVRGCVFAIHACGDIYATLYDKSDGTELLYVKDKSNSGRFGVDVLPYLKTDHALYAAMGDTHKRYRLDMEHNNWWECFVYTPEGEFHDMMWALDSDHIFEGVEVVLSAMDSVIKDITENKERIEYGKDSAFYSLYAPIVEEMGTACKGTCEQGGECFKVSYNPLYREGISKDRLSALRAQYPDIYDEFVDQTESRIFKVVKSAIA